MATMLAHLEEQPPLEGEAVAQVPPAMLPVLSRMLAKRAADRYSGCGPLLEALRHARGALEGHLTDSLSEPSRVEPPAAPDPSPRTARALAPRADVARLLEGPLLRALRHPDPSVREGAAAALAARPEERRPATEEPPGDSARLAAPPDAEQVRPASVAPPTVTRSRLPAVLVAATVLLVLALLFWLARLAWVA
jgi:hypothetical protein